MPSSAWLCYAASVVVIAAGVAVAVHLFPRDFDWTRTVISALASQKHNPAGSAGFSAALGLALGLLWPVTRALRPPGEVDRVARWSIAALRAGIVFALLVAAERFVFSQVFSTVRKGHEALALLAFLGIYAGVLGLQARHLRQPAGRAWGLLVAVPLAAVGISELVLYLGQRGVGWLDHDWGQSDLPAWARFAFWQWLALAALWLAIGHLLWLAGRRPEGNAGASSLS